MDKFRKIEEQIFKILMMGAMLSSFFLLGGIIITVAVKGYTAMNLKMICSLPQGGFYLGGEGGILNAIVGTLFLSTGACIISLMAAVPTAIYLNVYRKINSRFSKALRFSLDVLNGVPSIVYGAFGFTIMTAFGMRASLLTGMITVALIIVPFMTRTMDEIIRLVPEELSEVSYSTGATRFQYALLVVIRQTLPGLSTALLISFGRAAGDAAGVLFTAGFSDDIPHSLFDPVATLPLAVFFQLGTPSVAVQERAYASAFVLTLLILIISIAARIITGKLSKHSIR